MSSCPFENLIYLHFKIVDLIHALDRSLLLVLNAMNTMKSCLFYVSVFSYTSRAFVTCHLNCYMLSISVSNMLQIMIVSLSYWLVGQYWKEGHCYGRTTNKKSIIRCQLRNCEGCPCPKIQGLFLLFFFLFLELFVNILVTFIWG